MSTKGTNAAMALSNIAKSTWGTPYTYVRQLFQAVVAPRTDYAAIVWHRPKDDGSTTRGTQMRKLTTIQRLAMKPSSDATEPPLRRQWRWRPPMDPTPNQGPPCNYTDAITLRETSNTRMANKCLANKNRLHLTPIELRKHTATVTVYV